LKYNRLLQTTIMFGKNNTLYTSILIQKFTRAKLAEFKTHVTVSLFASGTAATWLLLAGRATEPEVMICFLLGGLGGVLPDLDADDSLIHALIFNALALSVSFLMIFELSQGHSLLQLLMIWMLTFLVIKYPLAYAFSKFTRHRGLLHSLPAGLLLLMLLAVFCQRILEFDARRAWLYAVFPAGGFIIHLLLDELYSLNVLGFKAKRSLGTAIKFYSKDNILLSLLLYVLLFALIKLMPDLSALLAKI
jgi:hypothetical protein